MVLVSPLNRDVPPARPGEFAELRLGDRIRLRSPVVLAPMAGITNAPFRVLCRRFGEALFVSEMITARGLVEGNRRTRELCRFLPEESPRSLQLYGSEPRWLEEAARILVGEGRVDHLDLNLGCPVRKVTAAGGGAAIPWRLRLLARLCGALRRGTGDRVPFTVKMRLGIDEDHLTHLGAGRVAEQEGAAAVGLHARTAAQLYDGQARWEAIAELQQALAIPVLGNGDLFEAHDALRMMRMTGCAGVILGRGCLGRPWLFRELEALFAGNQPPDPPGFAEVRDICLEHARLLCAFFGPELGILQMRKHATWYTRSFPGAATIRAGLCRVTSLAELAHALSGLDPNLPFPPEGLRARRCKSGGTQKVSLPPGYLEDPDRDEAPATEVFVEGG